MTDHCEVCNAVASIMRGNSQTGKVQHLCRRHYSVCLAHLKDPCPICDADGPAGIDQAQEEGLDND